jgi:hypothetical protein
MSDTAFGMKRRRGGIQPQPGTARAAVASAVLVACLCASLPAGCDIARPDTRADLHLRQHAVWGGGTRSKSRPGLLQARGLAAATATRTLTLRGGWRNELAAPAKKGAGRWRDDQPGRRGGRGSGSARLRKETQEETRDGVIDVGADEVEDWSPSTMRPAEGTRGAMQEQARPKKRKRPVFSPLKVTSAQKKEWLEQRAQLKQLQQHAATGNVTAQLLFGKRLIARAHTLSEMRRRSNMGSKHSSTAPAGGGMDGDEKKGSAAAVSAPGVVEGVKWVEKAADAGNVEAAELVASWCLGEGGCLPRDCGRAYRLYRTLALGGASRIAAWKLGYCLDHGLVTS